VAVVVNSLVDRRSEARDKEVVGGECRQAMIDDIKVGTYPNNSVAVPWPIFVTSTEIRIERVCTH